MISRLLRLRRARASTRNATVASANKAEMSSPSNSGRRLSVDSIKALDRQVGRFDALAHICAAAVVIGVCIEYVPQAIAFLKRPNWATFSNLIGGILIALGVAGEILFGALVSRRENRIRNSLDLTVAALGVETEKAKLERIHLEHELAMRDVTSEQRAEIITKLSQWAGQRVELFVFPPGVETAHLAWEIAHALRASGWIVPTRPEPTLTSNVLLGPGLWVESTEDERSREAANAALMALADVAGGGAGGALGALPNPENPRVRLTVFEKHGRFRSSLQTME